MKILFDNIIRYLYKQNNEGILDEMTKITNSNQSHKIFISRFVFSSPNMMGCVFISPNMIERNVCQHRVKLKNFESGYPFEKQH